MFGRPRQKESSQESVTRRVRNVTFLSGYLLLNVHRVSIEKKKTLGTLFIAQREATVFFTIFMIYSILRESSRKDR